MIKKLTLICFIFAAILISINLRCLAQEEIEKTDLQKVIDINDRITQEYIESFAAKRNLNFVPIPSIEELKEATLKEKFENISFSAQKQIGLELLDQFLITNKLYVNDPLLNRYVATVGKLVASNFNNQQGFLFTFGIVDDPNIRVYSLPGGYIFITKGYLKTIENEAQLAAALAREIGSFNNNLLLKTIKSNDEAYTLLTSLKKLIEGDSKASQVDISSEEKNLAQKPFSDPLLSLDYYASPSFENMYTNKEYLTKKLLKKINTLIPTFETILLKDKLAVQNLEKAGYDMESTKDLLLTLNKKHKQYKIINRSINIENWLGDKTLKNKKRNKVEGRYMMMVERLSF